MSLTWKNQRKKLITEEIMERWKDEKRLLTFTYLLAVVCFLNLSTLRWPLDTGALIMGVIVCIIIFYTNFVVRRFFPDGDKYIFVFVSILSLIGIVMLYRLDAITAIKQLLWFTCGFAVFIMIVILMPDLKKLFKLKYLFLALTVILMSLGTLFAQAQFGSKNWINLGFATFQPSEFGKIFLIAYLAAALKDYSGRKQLIEPALIVMISLGFMVLQKDLGSALIFFSIAVTMLYIATTKIKYVIFCFVLFIGGALISYQLFGHVRLRYMIWQNPWPYANNESYQIVQSMFSIASGGLFGSGLGLGHPDFVPVAVSDFIFSAISEEFGFLTALGLIMLFFLLIYRSMRAALHTNDNFLQLLAVGYSAMIASQVIVIVGGVINMIPLTGITLPFVSYGGSSMIVSFISIALIQKISEEG